LYISEETLFVRLYVCTLVCTLQVHASSSVTFLTLLLFSHHVNVHVNVHANVNRQTSITLEFKPHPQVPSYQLSWKQYPQSWQEADSKTITIGPSPTSATIITAQATDLLPATTYCVRIAANYVPNGDASPSSSPISSPSPELIVDTEAIGCTPKTESCCVLQ